MLTSLNIKLLLYVSINFPTSFQVEILIIDLEKANGTARELQKRTEQLERVNIEIKSRLEETVQIYEQTQRDLRIKITEIQRISHELDKTREQKDALGRENKKLGGMFTAKCFTIVFSRQPKFKI